jgi:hypothetical protein
MDEKCIDGIFCLVDGLLGDVFRQASFIKRIPAHSEIASYQVSYNFSLLHHYFRVITSEFLL